MRDRIEAIYRSESRRVLATLIRLLRDFDLAEEALQNAFVAAFERWPREGEPANPRAWLVSAGRFRAIDNLRRRATYDAKLAEIARELDSPASSTDIDEEVVEDDRLRLIFTCCHPALAPEAQVALTLRTVCGLTTEEIANAYLVPPPTLAQRIVRAKNKIRDARIPYAVPARAELPDRLDAVLHVIYLVFNEAYSASFGAALTRSDLSSEAIRLGRLLLELLDDGEVRGLLALMLLHDARRATRTGSRRRRHPPCRPGSLALGPGPDRRGTRAPPARARSRAHRAVWPAGRDRRPARRGAVGGGNGLGADRRAVRRADARGANARGRTQSRSGSRDVIRSGRGARAHRRDPGARGTGGLPARALRTCRVAATAGPRAGCPRGVRARARPDHGRAVAPLYPGPARSARDVGVLSRLSSRPGERSSLVRDGRPCLSARSGERERAENRDPESCRIRSGPMTLGPGSALAVARLSGMTIGAVIPVR